MMQVPFYSTQARSAARRVTAAWLAALLLWLLVAGPGPSQAAEQLPARVAVINYHEVLPEPTSPYVVTPGRLEQDLRWFLDNGWSPLSLSQFRAWMDGRLDLTGDHFLLTFDDGYRGTYQHGYPVLKRLRVPAVYFVVTRYMAQDGHWLTAEEIRAIAADGLVSIQSHSHNLHYEVNTAGGPLPVVHTLSGPALAADLDTSRQLLAETTGEWPAALAWPFGAAPPQAVRVAGERFALLFEGHDRFVTRGDYRHVTRFAMEWRSLENLAQTFAPRQPVGRVDTPPSRRGVELTPRWSSDPPDPPPAPGPAAPGA